MTFKEWLALNLNKLLEVKMNWSGSNVLGIKPAKPYPVRRRVFIAEVSQDKDYVVFRFDSAAQAVAAELHFTDAQRVIDAPTTDDLGMKTIEVDEGEGTIAVPA